MPSADIHLVSTLIKHKYTSHKNLYKEKLPRYKRATRRHNNSNLAARKLTSDATTALPLQM